MPSDNETKAWLEKEGCAKYLQKLDDNLAMYAFLLLIAYLPANPKNRGSNKQNVKAFIDFKPQGTDLEEYLLQARAQTQPYLLCIGERWEPLQYFIIVDSNALTCESNIVAAVDKLFKCHYVFNVHYAAQVKVFYQFLEAVVYGMTSMQRMPNKIVELSSAIEGCIDAPEES